MTSSLVLSAHSGDSATGRGIAVGMDRALWLCFLHIDKTAYNQPIVMPPKEYAWAQKWLGCCI